MSEYVVNSEYSGEPWGIENGTQSYTFMADEDKGKGPNPVEYLAGAVNSCISISAAMLAQHRKLDVHNFKIKNTAHTRKLGLGKSDVDTMKLEISFDTNMNEAEKAKFIKRTLEVSTVYQTVSKAVDIEIEIL